jgi:hypothetical protein
MEDADLHETLAELCKRAEAEQDFQKLLQLASLIQPLIEAKRSRLTANIPFPEEPKP